MMGPKSTFLFTFVIVLFIGLTAASFTAASSTSPEAPGRTTSDVTPSEEIYVSAGEFLMGCSEDTAGALGCALDAMPIHAVYLDAFYIDKTEITNAQYAECVNVGKCLPPTSFSSSSSRPSYYNNITFADYPVLYVDWERANAYCQWIGKRLPTEAEWEKAARGADRRPFAWGYEALTCDKTNSNTYYCNEQGELRERPCVGDTTPVGSYPQFPSPYGALDMTGNVREWVSDFYVKLYYQRSPYYNPTVLDYGDKGEHLVRGGSWKEVDYHSTVWFRFDEHDIYETHLIGFRCARTSSQGTPTPTPVPSPTPTSTPYAQADIDAEGGAIWLTYPNHLTLLTFPKNALDAQTAFTLTYNRLFGTQNLQANNHSFSIEAHQQVSNTELSQFYLHNPARLTVGYHELSGIISNTIDLYRLTASGWTTEQITKVAQAPNYIIADIHWLGIYGVMGETNRTYLPLILRK